jgi:aromatic-amino-acid transaminase
VQSTYKDEWLKDMEGARQMLQKKREVLRSTLPADLRPALEGNGMFALLPLSAEEVETLKTEHLVFLAGSGRLNIAGIPLKRMEELGEKIRKVKNAK